MLSAKVEDGFVQFFFKERPSKPDWNGDGALDIRIPNACDVRLVLDPEIRWSFRHSFDPDFMDDINNDAVTLDPQAIPDVYTNLRHISDREVVFSAIKKLPYTTITLPFPPYVIELLPLRDQFNIYVELDQLVAAKIPGSKALDSKRLLIKIDPDIQNPGDNTQGGGGKSLEFYLKDKLQLLKKILEEIEDHDNR